jgi:DNA-binding NarL/FixJ family response regulator
MENVLFLGNDLMFQSKISSACRAAGLNLKVVRKPNELSADWLEEPQPKLVIVDLGLPGLELAQVYGSLHAQIPDAKWLGYAAHVLEDRLQEAKALGLDAVITRGQFERDIVGIVQSIAPSENEGL